MSDTELIQILKEIANDCFYRRNCGGCKFDNNGSCNLSGTPESWDIENMENADGTMP